MAATVRAACVLAWCLSVRSSREKILMQPVCVKFQLNMYPTIRNTRSITTFTSFVWLAFYWFCPFCIDFTNISKVRCASSYCFHCKSYDILLKTPSSRYDQYCFQVLATDKSAKPYNIVSFKLHFVRTWNALRTMLYLVGNPNTILTTTSSENTRKYL